MMRLTSHRARAGKDGVFSPKHNSRSGIGRGDGHIDVELSRGNVYWIYDRWCRAIRSATPDFDEHEHRRYEELFSAWLDAHNRRAVEARHADRVLDADAYRGKARTCPEEAIFQIGKSGGHASAWTLRRVYEDFVAWHVASYPQAVLLDAAMHLDEPDAAPHVHVRQVWVGHDGAGRACVSQARALKEMGVPLPDPTAPESRYNSRKMTYTAACRAKLFEIARRHGLELEEAPQAASRVGLPLLDYKAREARARAAEAEAALAESVKAAEAAKVDLAAAEARAAALTEPDPHERTWILSRPAGAGKAIVAEADLRDLERTAFAAATLRAAYSRQKAAVADAERAQQRADALQRDVDGLRRRVEALKGILAWLSAKVPLIAPVRRIVASCAEERPIDAADVAEAARAGIEPPKGRSVKKAAR